MTAVARRRRVPADTGRRPRVGTVRAAAAAARTCRSRGDVTYRSTPDRVEARGRTVRHRAARTSAFDGTTAWGGESTFRFHVTSGDWQESDQVLAGILTDFGRRPAPVAFGGRGEFDGGMTGAVPAAARRGPVHRRGPARLGHDLGRGVRAHRRREQLRHGHATASIRHRRLGDPRRRAVLARLSAPRRRRGDRRALPRDAARRRQPAARLRDRRLSGVGPADRRVPPDRRVRAPDRLRRA